MSGAIPDPCAVWYHDHAEGTDYLLGVFDRHAAAAKLTMPAHSFEYFVLELDTLPMRPAPGQIERLNSERGRLAPSGNRAA